MVPSLRRVIDIGQSEMEGKLREIGERTRYIRWEYLRVEPRQCVRVGGSFVRGTVSVTAESGEQERYSG